MKKRISIIILLLIFCLLCLISCSNNIITYNVSTLSRYKGDVISAKDWNAKQIIKTADELIQFSSKYDISEYILEYNAKYFVDKAIIVYLFSYAHLGANVKIQSVEKKEDSVIINVLDTQKIFAQYAAEIDYWICIIEVGLNDVQEINNIEIVTKVKRRVL